MSIHNDIVKTIPIVTGRRRSFNPNSISFSIATIYIIGITT